MSLKFKRFKIQEGLLTNAKVYIHVTIWIKVVTQTAMYSQYYIAYMIYKGTMMFCANGLSYPGRCSIQIYEHCQYKKSFHKTLMNCS